jgi:ubiquinone/menaquinone biosynthesis C-methylase UbiE
MRFYIAQLVKTIMNLFAKPYVLCGEFILPPKWSRWGGKIMRDDDYFLKSGEEEADRLIEHFGLSTNSSILDVGCGPGRVALGILSRLGEIKKYVGVDVHKKSIEWCKRYIQNDHPSFKFFQINVRNERYNREGNVIDNEFQFTFNKHEFDVIYLFSVFSHMTADVISQYLKEFQRILCLDGKIFLTGFFEKNVPDISVNPKNYYASVKGGGPLKDVRYSVDYFEKLLFDNGFKIDRFDYRILTMANKQSAMYVSRI